MKEISKNYKGRIDTREELLERLNLYKGILSDHVINYLNSIIELDFSVLKDYLSIDEKNALSELDIYKRAAIYNIYERAVNLVKDFDYDIKIFGNEYGIPGLNIYLENNRNKMFLFTYNYAACSKIKEKVPDGYKTMNLGNISLYQTLENSNLREQEYERVINKLDELYKQYDNEAILKRNSASWIYALRQEIERYEILFQKLIDEKELTNEEKYSMEITNKIHELFMEDYSLSRKSFDDINKTYNKKSESKLEKTLVKKMSNLTVTDNIKYI